MGKRVYNHERKLTYFGWIKLKLVFEKDKLEMNYDAGECNFDVEKVTTIKLLLDIPVDAVAEDFYSAYYCYFAGVMANSVTVKKADNLNCFRNAIFK